MRDTFKVLFIFAVILIGLAGVVVFLIPFLRGYFIDPVVELVVALAFMVLWIGGFRAEEVWVYHKPFRLF